MSASGPSSKSSMSRAHETPLGRAPHVRMCFVFFNVMGPSSRPSTLSAPEADWVVLERLLVACS
eukprot:1159359-Pelagomonas_calceolata.AAC.2